MVRRRFLGGLVSDLDRFKVLDTAGTPDGRVSPAARWLRRPSRLCTRRERGHITRNWLGHVAGCLVATKEGVLHAAQYTG